VLRLAWSRLADDGLLVACCNTTFGKPYPLADAVKAAAREAGARIEEVRAPALGDDVPQLAGFPEGRPYRLVAVRRLR